ncbi:MAG: DUF389 domain-containing protein [Prevotella sp.]|nr:DUF389 domain-containing protein [Prevotella sp.]
MNFDLKNLAGHVSDYFNLQPDKDDEQAIIAQISSGVSFRGANLWVLIFAIFIASLGLNVNSTAVIIGAMLISPLMGPIIGMGLAVGINDLELLKRSAKNYGVASLISVLTATVYFFLTPLGEAQSELLARTSPTLYDVLIAFCGGAAGIIALCTRGKGNVIPGVAIATALMPPLCTAGYGLATGHLLYFLGAFYLFFINTVFIALATYLGVRMMHFKRSDFMDSDMTRKSSRVVMGIVVLTMIPALVMTIGIVRRSFFQNNVNKFVKNELAQKGTQILSSEADGSVLNIVAVGREIGAESQAEAQRRMAQYGLEDYELKVIQGVQTDSLLQLNTQVAQLNTTREADRQRLVELSAEAAQLNQQLSVYARYDDLAAEIRPELSALFPQVTAIGLTPVVEARIDSLVQSRYVAAIVTTAKSATLTHAERQRLHDWLKARVQADSLVVIGR